LKLGVITATRGTSEFLGETLASVRALPGEVAHVLVAPSKAHATLAKRLVGESLLAEPDTGAGGLYGALNLARVSLTDCPAVTYLNDDDLLRPLGVAAALTRLATADVVYGRVALIDARGTRLGELPVARDPRDFAVLLRMGIMPLAQPGTLIRREWLERLNWFRAEYRMAGDLDFFVRAWAAGARFAYVNTVVSAFRLHAGQLSKDAAAASAEHARALQTLPVGDDAGMCRLGAWLRFRWANRRIYAERIRLHGWRRMAALYRHE
jgi:GT2 family glycosyltransferase